MSDLAEFLLARITEQESRCEALLLSPRLPHSLAVRRTLAVGADTSRAIRRIIGRHTPHADAEVNGPCVTLRLLAEPYRFHPGFDASWLVTS